MRKQRRATCFVFSSRIIMRCIKRAKMPFLGKDSKHARLFRVKMQPLPLLLTKGSSPFISNTIIMRKSTFLSLLLLSVWYISTSSRKDPNNPPLARTGAPGETTCGASGCHSGGTFTGTVTISGIPDTISANTSYSVTLTNTSNAVRAGFQLTCLDSLNAKCGSLTNGTGTSTGSQSSTGRQYIRQSAPKALSNGAAS